MKTLISLLFLVFALLAGVPSFANSYTCKPTHVLTYRSGGTPTLKTASDEDIQIEFYLTISDESAALSFPNNPPVIFAHSKTQRTSDGKLSRYSDSASFDVNELLIRDFDDVPLSVTMIGGRYDLITHLNAEC